MTIGSLNFRSPYGNVDPEDIPGGLALRGEVEWFVEGIEVEVGALLAAVGSLGVKVSMGSASLRFGNVVGTFDLGSLGTLKVRCGKWGEEVFDALLEDLTRKILALPFSAAQTAAIPHDRSIADRDDVLLHAFIYARHILLAAQGDQSLARALELVVRDPHRLFGAERTSVSLAAVRRVDARTITRIAAGAGGVVRATGSMAQTSLAIALRGHLPEYVDVPKVEHTFDTAENRFVLEFIKQIRALVEHVERLALAKGKPSVFWNSTLKDCEAMRRVLGPFERHDVWNDVSRMDHVPIGSAVLQRRRGYQDVLRHHLALRAAARIPLDKDSVEKRLLGTKDVAKLYELWCYFTVVEVVRGIVGRDADVVEEERIKVDEVAIRHGFKVAWNGGPAVHYNPSFSMSKEPPYRSASLLLRPDIVVEVQRDVILEFHVFDAKLKVDGIADRGEASDEDEPNTLKYGNEDVAKMHAYRDALPSVRSARVLYPGNVAHAFVALEHGALPTDVVGATPLIPGIPPDELITVLRAIVGIGGPTC